jgi:hypothetical protein
MFIDNSEGGRLPNPRPPPFRGGPPAGEVAVRCRRCEPGDLLMDKSLPGRCFEACNCRELVIITSLQGCEG